MLLHVDVTEADIDIGDDCPESCPVALALNRALAAAGMPDHTAEWEPYDFTEPRGLEVWRDDPGGGDPELLLQLHPGDCPGEMYDVASLFDDWYRSDDDEDDPEAPGRPAPVSFEIDLPLAQGSGA